MQIYAISLFFSINNDANPKKKRSLQQKIHIMNVFSDYFLYICQQKLKTHNYDDAKTTKRDVVDGTASCLGELFQS